MLWHVFWIVSHKRMSRIRSPGKPTLKWKLVQEVDGERSQTQHLGENKRSKIGQKENLDCDAISSETLVKPWGTLVLWCAFRAGPHWGRSQPLYPCMDQSLDRGRPRKDYDLEQTAPFYWEQLLRSPQQATLFSSWENECVSSKAESRWQAITSLQHTINNNLACICLDACEFGWFWCTSSKNHCSNPLGWIYGPRIGVFFIN